MGAMQVCSCGWTLISPLGADDIVYHVQLHLKEHHPGTKLSESEIRELIRTV
ncbi:MAG TPA: DUF1059 domain-containing protein [Thermoplasmata archaeon]|nr:DUF1059 domain-containing protein [Thermoplasmata archaeon]